MATILQFIRKDDGAFDDRVASLVGRAFDAAVRELHDKGQPSLVLEVMARRIIEAAKKGERNVERLRDVALSAIERKQ